MQFGTHRSGAPPPDREGVQDTKLECFLATVSIDATRDPIPPQCGHVVLTPPRVVLPILAPCSAASLPVMDFGSMFPEPGSDAELLFIGHLLDSHCWSPGADQLRAAANDDPLVIRRILNQSMSPPAADAQASVARLWFCTALAQGR